MRGHAAFVTVYLPYRHFDGRPAHQLRKLVHHPEAGFFPGQSEPNNLRRIRRFTDPRGNLALGEKNRIRLLGREPAAEGGPVVGRNQKRAKSFCFGPLQLPSQITAVPLALDPAAVRCSNAKSNTLEPFRTQAIAGELRALEMIM